MQENVYKDPFAAECNQYARKFDDAFNAKDWVTTEHLIAESEELLKLHPNDYAYAPLYYSLGTSYGDLAQHLDGCSTIDIQEKELHYYRVCIELLSTRKLMNPEYKPYVTGLKLPLYTNYANVLSNCGRKIYAIQYYRKVLEIKPDFHMARGNIGVALLYYSTLAHDAGHQDYLNYFAYQNLKSALSDDAKDVHPEAREYFEQVINRFNTNYVSEFLEKPLQIRDYSLGGKQEKRYRMWCLQNHFFLNPLNDLPLLHSCFATDSLQLPAITTTIDEKDIPIFFGLFNQIKQDFIYARFLFYQGQVDRSTPHYADKETGLTNLFDYPQYSIRIENEKTAFRLLYSLFDKVAFFANKYWKLGIKDTDVTFHSVWREESGHRPRYKHRALDTKSNIALLAMNWIYKDFNECFGDSPNPELKKFNVLRNALEHKYVKVHSDILYDNSEPYIDQEGTYHISEGDLYRFTHELMCMIRELIIELSMAVHISESGLFDCDESPKFVPNITLGRYEDEWKI